jgi:hypothetical protein
MKHLLISLLLLLTLTGCSAKHTYTPYTVQANDTLWSIAEQCELKQDISKTVYEIREKNGITPIIHEGQTILIPEM